MTAPAVQSQSYDSYTPTTAGHVSRISSLDFVKGLVMVIMAIDHVRVYAGVPAGGPPPSVFFTRWITHFVAPAFCFFAGTSIFLHGRKLGDKTALSKFLLSRGAWLIFLELTVLRLAWTFNFDFKNYMIAGVIWMLGWCMILMAAFSRLSAKTNAIVGVAIIFLHNALGGVLGAIPGPIGTILYRNDVANIFGLPFFVLFVIVPWIGVMMAGYAFGEVLLHPAPQRKKEILTIGITATVVFLVLRSIDFYGDPRHWHVPANATEPPRLSAPLRFLNTTKYPASLDFLLMTLGPTLILMAYADRIRGKVSEVLQTFGRVPFFFYLLHIPLIHLAAVVVSAIREGSVNPWLFGNHPINPPEVPAGYRWSLLLLYAVWAVVIFTLYFPCKWFARVRAEKKNPLLSYL